MGKPTYEELEKEIRLLKQRLIMLIRFIEDVEEWANEKDAFKDRAKRILDYILGRG